MKEMISREKFCEIIEEMRDINEIQEKMGKLFRNSKNEMLREFGTPDAMIIANEGVIVDLLNDMFGLKDDDTLDWWIWECNYGKEVEPDSVIDDKIGFVDLTTPEKLYDYLISLKGEENG